MQQRVITALVGLPLLLGALYLGGFALSASVFILIMLADSEWERMQGNSSLNRIFAASALLGLVFAHYGSDSWFGAGFSSFFLLTFIKVARKYPPYEFSRFSAEIFGYLYVFWTLSHLILVRRLEHGFSMLIFFFIVIFATDTVAYLWGTAFGKKPLAPGLSPKKSKEGSVAGLVAGSTGGAIYGYFHFPADIVLMFLTALLVSVAGQAGDLLESYLKRESGIKDSGDILPGHGGILDRFDSTMAALPLFYYLLKIFIF